MVVFGRSTVFLLTRSVQSPQKKLGVLFAATKHLTGENRDNRGRVALYCYAPLPLFPPIAFSPSRKNLLRNESYKPAVQRNQRQNGGFHARRLRALRTPRFFPTGPPRYRLRRENQLDAPRFEAPQILP